MMVPCSSIYKTILEEVDIIADVDQLKQIVKKLIRENHILARRTNSVIKSLENQNTLIKYLQETLMSMMARNTMQADVLWGVLGSETLRTFDDVVRYQMLINDVAKNHSFGEGDKKIIDELMNAALTVPYENVQTARAKCVAFLDNLKNRGYDFLNKEEVNGTEDTEEIEKSSSTKHKSVKAMQVRKQQYKEILKKRREKINRRKSVTTSRRHSLNKLQNSKPINSSKKNYRKKNSLISAKSANSQGASQSDINNIHSENFSRRQRLKRKSENTDESCLNLKNNLVPVDKTLEKNLVSSKKMRNTPNSVNSIKDTAQSKTLVIKLNDFMIDSSADNDQYIAQYKQAFAYKENEENEYEVVDDVDCDDVDSDQRAGSDQNSDNEEDGTSFKTPESEDNQESSLSEGNDDEVAKDRKIGIQGPCTPPLSPLSDDILAFRRGPRTPSPPRPVYSRGPRTPSHSPPVYLRGPRTPPGPCTPPGVAPPTSDCEVSGRPL